MMYTRIIVGIGLDNERRCYNVKSSLIGWAYTQNDSCNIYGILHQILRVMHFWVNLLRFDTHKLHMSSNQNGVAIYTSIYMQKYCFMSTIINSGIQYIFIASEKKNDFFKLFDILLTLLLLLSVLCGVVCALLLRHGSHVCWNTPADPRPILSPFLQPPVWVSQGALTAGRPICTITQTSASRNRARLLNSLSRVCVGHLVWYETWYAIGWCHRHLSCHWIVWM